MAAMNFMEVPEQLHRLLSHKSDPSVVILIFPFLLSTDNNLACEKRPKMMCVGQEMLPVRHESLSTISEQCIVCLYELFMLGSAVSPG